VSATYVSRSTGPNVYQRPALYPKQLDAIFCPERYAIIEASTKSGKSAGCFTWLFEQALQAPVRGARYYWVAPWYKTARIMFDRATEKMGLPTSLYRANKSDLSLTLRRNGAVIEFRSAEKPDTLYGDDCYAAVLDEITRMRQEAFVAIRTTVTATQGPVRMIGNVTDRKNFAYHLARRAEAGEPSWHYAKLTAWDAVEAGVLAHEEIEDAARLLSPEVFAALYMAEAAEDGTCPFRPRFYPQPVSTKQPVAWGWDLGKSVDYTWGIGLDEDGRVCRSERWQRRPWPTTFRLIVGLTAGVPALVDATGLGDPSVESIQQQAAQLHGTANFEGFVFTMPSKQEIMESLGIAFEQDHVTLVDCACLSPVCVHCVLRAEVAAFQYEYTRLGVRYAAPEGMHDDGVCALALAHRKWAGVRKSGGVQVW